MPKKNDARKTTTSLHSDWLQKALKSMGAAGTQVIKEIMPATSETVGSMTRVATDAAKTLRSGKAGENRLKDALSSNPAVKMGKDFFRNALADLKSGNLYNENREMEGFGGDDDTLFGDMDDFFGDDDFGGEVNVDIDNNIIENNGSQDGGATLKAINKQTEYQVKSSKATMDAMVAMSSSAIMKVSEIGNKVVSELTSIGSNISALVEYNSTNVTKFIEASISYYQQMTQAAESSSGGGSNKITADQLFSSAGGLDFSQYKDYIKQNIKAVVEESPAGMLKMVLDNPEAFVSNPIGSLLTGGIKKIIPQVVKSAAEEIDNSFKNFIPTMLERLGDMGREGSGHGAILKTIAKIFGIRSDRKEDFDLSNVNKGPMPYNGIANHTIVEIIPKYLRESNNYLRAIAEAVTKKSDAELSKGVVGYDWQTGRFTNLNSMRDTLYQEVIDSVINKFQFSDFGKKMAANQGALSRKSDREAYGDALNQLYLAMERHTGQIEYGSKKDGKFELSSDITDIINSLNTNNRIKDLITASIYDMASHNDPLIGSSYIAKREATREKTNAMRSIEEESTLRGLYQVYDGRNFDQYVADRTVKNNQPMEAAYTGSGRILLSTGAQSEIERSRRRLIPFTSDDAGDENAARRQDIHGFQAWLQNNRSTDATLIETGDRIIDKIASAFKGFAGTMNGIMAGNADQAWEEFLGGFKGLFAKTKSLLFGDKDEEGYSQKGILAGIGNSIHETLYSVRRKITGKGYKTADGQTIPDMKDDEMGGTIIGKLNNAVNWVKTSISKQLFGEDAVLDDKGNVIQEEKIGIIGKAKQKLSNVADSLAQGFVGWRKALFGDKVDDTGDPKEDVKKTWESLKKKAKEVAPDSIIGAGGGVLAGSLLGGLVGGPLGGAILGMAGGIAKNSDKFQNWLFGEADENGERQGGIISKEVQDYAKENGKYIAGGGALGLLVGGPVGALVGMGTSMVAKSNAFHTFLFGDAESGQIGITTNLKRWMRQLTSAADGSPSGGKLGGMMAIGAAGGGLLGALVGGPIVGSVLGLGASILASKDNFREWFFGTEWTDEEGNTHKREGVLGQFKNMLSVHVFTPIANTFKDIGGQFKIFLQHDVLGRLNIITEKLGNSFFGMLSKVTGKFMGGLGDFSNYIKDNFLQGFIDKAQKVLSPLVDAATGVAKGIWNVGRRLISAPLKLISAITSPITKAVTGVIAGVAKVAFKSADLLIFKPIKNLVIKPLAFLTKTAFKVVTAPFKLLGNIANKVGSKLTELTDHVSLFFRKIGNDLLNKLKNNKFTNFIKGIGRDIKDAILTPVKSIAHSVKNAFGVLTDTVKKGLGKFFGWINPINWIKKGIQKRREKKAEKLANMTEEERGQMYGAGYNEKGLLGYLSRKWKEAKSGKANDYSDTLTYDENGNIAGAKTTADQRDSENTETGLSKYVQHQKRMEEKRALNANEKLIAKWTKNQRKEFTEENKALAEAEAKRRGEVINWDTRVGTIKTDHEIKVEKAQEETKKFQVNVEEMISEINDFIHGRAHKTTDAKLKYDESVKKAQDAIDNLKKKKDDAKKRADKGDIYATQELADLEAKKDDIIAKREEFVDKLEQEIRYDESIKQSKKNRIIGLISAANRKQLKQFNKDWKGKPGDATLKNDAILAEAQRIIDGQSKDDVHASISKDINEKPYNYYGQAVIECPKCHKFNEPNAKKCYACGAKISREIPKMFGTNEINRVYYDEKDAREAKEKNAAKFRPAGGEQAKACPKCGTLNKMDADKCYNCGRKLKKAKTITVPAYASGTTSAKAGPTIVGEEGPEAIFKTGASSGKLVGVNGPEVIHTEGNETIIPNDRIEAQSFDATLGMSTLSDSELAGVTHTENLTIGERILGELYKINQNTSLLEDIKDATPTSSTEDNDDSDDEDGYDEEEDFDTTNIDELKGMWSRGKSRVSKKIRGLLRRIPGAGLIGSAIHGIGGAFHFGKTLIGAGREWSAIRKARKSKDAVLSGEPQEETLRPHEYSAEVNEKKPVNSEGLLMSAAMIGSEGGIDASDARDTEAILIEGTKAKPDKSRMVSKIKGLLHRNKDKDEASAKKSNGIWDTIKGILGGIGGSIGSLPGILAAVAGTFAILKNPGMLGDIIKGIGGAVNAISGIVGGIAPVIGNIGNWLGNIFGQKVNMLETIADPNATTSDAAVAGVNSTLARFDVAVDDVMDLHVPGSTLNHVDTTANGTDISNSVANHAKDMRFRQDMVYGAFSGGKAMNQVYATTTSKDYISAMQKSNKLLEQSIKAEEAGNLAKASKLDEKYVYQGKVATHTNASNTIAGGVATRLVSGGIQTLASNGLGAAAGGIAKAFGADNDSAQIASNATSAVTSTAITADLMRAGKGKSVVANTSAKLVDKAADSKIVKKIIGVIEKGMDFLSEKLKLEKVFKPIANKITGFFSKINKAVADKLLSKAPGLVEKAAAKLGLSTAAAASSVATMGISIAVGAVSGLASGLCGVEHLFGVLPGQADAGMTTISAIMGTIFGALEMSPAAPVVMLLDIIDVIISPIFGCGLKQALARLLYSAFGGSEELAEKQAAFEGERQYYADTYGKNLDTATYNDMVNNTGWLDKIWRGGSQYDDEGHIRFSETGNRIDGGIKSWFVGSDDIAARDAEGNLIRDKEGNILSARDEYGNVKKNDMNWGDHVGDWFKNNVGGFFAGKTVYETDENGNAIYDENGELIVKEKGKNIFERIGDTISNSTKWSLEHSVIGGLTKSYTIGYMASDGTYYDADGKHYTATGDLLEDEASPEDVAAMYKSGVLVKTQIQNKAADLKDAFANIKNNISNTWNTFTTGFGNIWNGVTNGLGDTFKAIQENGGVFKKSKSEVLFDTNGNYYKLRTDGNYDYYNMAGDLLEEDVDAEVIAEMHKSSLLTAGEVEGKSVAQTALEGIQKTVSNLWNGASNFFSNLFGITKSSQNTSGAISAAAMGAANAAKAVKSTNTQGGSGSGTSETTLNGNTYYSQNDPRWRDSKFRRSDGTDDGATMGTTGCGPTAMSMVISEMGKRKTTPTEMAEFAQLSGTRDETGTNANFIDASANAYGLGSVRNTNPSATYLKSALSSGDPMVLLGQDSASKSPYTSAGHYIVATGVDSSGNIIYNDPRGREYSGKIKAEKLAGKTGMAWAFGKKSGGRGIFGKTRRKIGGRGSEEENLRRWMKIVNAVKVAIAAYNAGYNQGAYRHITIDGVTKNVRFDCSGFVTACLWYYDRLPDSVLNMLSAESRAQKADSKTMLSTGFTPHEFTGWDNAQVGDIIIYPHHCEIYAGYCVNGHPQVYNCGNDTSTNTPGISGAAWHTDSGFEVSMLWSPGDPGPNAVNGDTVSIDDLGVKNAKIADLVSTVSKNNGTNGTQADGVGGKIAYRPSAKVQMGATVNESSSEGSESGSSIGDFLSKLTTGFSTIASKLWTAAMTGNWNIDWDNMNLDGTMKTDEIETSGEDIRDPAKVTSSKYLNATVPEFSGTRNIFEPRVLVPDSDIDDHGMVVDHVSDWMAETGRVLTQYQQARLNSDGSIIMPAAGNVSTMVNGFADTHSNAGSRNYTYSNPSIQNSSQYSSDDLEALDNAIWRLAEPSEGEKLLVGPGKYANFMNKHPGSVPSIEELQGFSNLLVSSDNSDRAKAITDIAGGMYIDSRTGKVGYRARINSGQFANLIDSWVNYYNEYSGVTSANNTRKYVSLLDALDASSNSSGENRLTSSDVSRILGAVPGSGMSDNFITYDTAKAAVIRAAEKKYLNNARLTALSSYFSGENNPDGVADAIRAYSLKSGIDDMATRNVIIDSWNEAKNGIISNEGENVLDELKNSIGGSGEGATISKRRRYKQPTTGGKGGLEDSVSAASPITRSVVNNLDGRKIIEAVSNKTYNFDSSALEALVGKVVELLGVISKNTNQLGLLKDIKSELNGTNITVNSTTNNNSVSSRGGNRVSQNRVANGSISIGEQTARRIAFGQ